MAAPLWMVVGVCCAMPLGWVLWQVLANPGAITEAAVSGFRFRLLVRTLAYNGLSAVIATAMALPAALVLGRGRGWVVRALWLALPISLLLPSLTYAYGWTQFLRLIDRLPEPASRWDVLRCIWSLATWLWPIPAAAVGLSLRRLDAEVQQQALLDGALWRVTLRQLAPSLLASAAVVAVLASQEFSVYEPTGISVVATEVRMVFETGAMSSADNPIDAVGIAGGAQALEPQDQSARAAAAVAAALPLLGVIAVLSAAVLWLIYKASSQEQVEVGGLWPRALDAGWIARALALIVVAVAVLVPAASLVLSLKVTPDPRRMWEEFSPQIIGSLSMAAVTSLVALGMAFWTMACRDRLMVILAVACFLAGGQLLAIALIRLYNRPVLSWAYNGPPIVIAAYLARFSWVALLAGGATWSRPWVPLRDLAAVDGAGPVRTAAEVLWPLAWPMLAAAAVLIMALGLVEVPATVLISPQRPRMLTPTMMNWVHMLRYDVMIEASLLLMGIVAVLGAGVAWLVGFGFHRLRWRRVALASLILTAGVLCPAGCSDRSKPDAVWCETGTGPSQVVYPRAIAYSRQDDSFFVIDRVARVQHLDRNGKCVDEWRMPQWQQGKPVGVTVGPDGNVYVPDTHYHRVMVYSPRGELIRQWGSNGSGPGQFIYPTDIAFDSAGRIFVSEYGDNDRIQVFDPQGKYLYAFGRFGSEAGEFMRPQSMVIDGDTLYITDACNHRIAVFKTDGTFVRNMGSAGSGPGEFRFPYGLDKDSRGRLIVCEFGNNRVQLVDKQTGRGLATWGSGGHDIGELAYPWGVAVDRAGRVVAVDAGNNRLQVFEF